MYALFVTNLPEIFEKAVQTFNQNKYVKIALGYHPQMAGKYKFNSKLFDTLLPLTKYIGEVGLDFSKDYISTKSQQLDAFQHICREARKENKILSIHSRMAEKDVLNILLENDVQNAVFHWYTGNLETLEKIMQHGYYFSVNYSMLRSKRGLEIVRSIPSK
ncbi:3'-5' ssDNA/RNA exonuclease TatD [Ureibacillus acetophenoni]